MKDGLLYKMKIMKIYYNNFIILYKLKLKLKLKLKTKIFKII